MWVGGARGGDGIHKGISLPTKKRKKKKKEKKKNTKKKKQKKESRSSGDQASLISLSYETMGNKSRGTVEKKERRL